MLVMLIHDQCLLQGSRNMWHLYTTEKYSSLDINHCFQYFTQAATLGTLLQLTKFLKTEIIKKKKKKHNSIWGTARQLKCLQFRVCRIAMDF